MSATGDRRRTPIPRRDNEDVGAGYSAVKSYTLPPDELEKLRSSLPAPPSDASGKQLKAPIKFKSQVHALVRSSIYNPDKVQFLRLIAEGKRISDAEKKWNMKKGSLSYWVKKWGLRGITPGKAKEILAKGVQP